MKITHSITIVLTSILLFNSCNSDNDWIDLGDGYVWTDSESIIPRQMYYGTQVYPKVVDFNFNDRYIIIKQKPNLRDYKYWVTQDLSSRMAIYDNTINNRLTEDDLKNTTPFIEKSIKADSLLYKKMIRLGITGNNTVQDLNKIHPIVDSLFSNDLFYKKVLQAKINYWIIDKDNNIRLGPYDQFQFEKKLKSNKIDLKFN